MHHQLLFIFVRLFENFSNLHIHEIFPKMTFIRISFVKFDFFLVKVKVTIAICFVFPVRYRVQSSPPFSLDTFSFIVDLFAAILALRHIEPIVVMVVP